MPGQIRNVTSPAGLLFQRAAIHLFVLAMARVSGTDGRATAGANAEQLGDVVHGLTLHVQDGEGLANVSPCHLGAGREDVLQCTLVLLQCEVKRVLLPDGRPIT